MPETPKPKPKSSTKTPEQLAAEAAAKKPTPAPSPSAGSKKSNGGGSTLTPSEAAETAVAGLNNNGGTTGTQSLLPGGQLINVDAEGKPIAYYGVKFAEKLFSDYAANSQSKEIANIQRKLVSIGAYPKNYTPTYGLYSQTDVDALKSIGYIGEQLREPNLDNVFKKIQTTPALLNKIQTGGVGTAAKTLTSTAEAAAVLTDQYLNVFNVKPTTAEVKAYTNAINAKEKASKTALSAQERQDILLNVMNQKAAKIGAAAMAGDTKAAQEGSFGATVRSLRDAYFSNGVKVNDATLYKQAGQAMRGSEAYNNIISNIQINAKAMLPALSQYIDQGKQVRDILNSHIQRYADIYGVDPDSVDLNQISFVANGSNLMSTNDMVKQLWNTDPKIKQTQYYTDVMTNDARSLINMLGIG